jgi:glutathione S-transferase
MALDSPALPFNAAQMTRTLMIGDYNLSSWSLRPWLALDHSGLSFETEVIRLDRPDTRAKLEAASPTAKVPCLRDGALVVWESLAISELVAELAPQAHLWPEDRDTRAVARAVASEMHAGFVTLRKEHPMRLAERMPKAASPDVLRDLGRIDALVADCRTRFGQSGPFLFGTFSIADCMFAPVATRIRTYGLPVARTTTAWCEAVFAHPSFKRWERAAEREVAER